VDPVPDPLLLRKSGGAGNRTPTSGSVARNSDRRGGLYSSLADSGHGVSSIRSLIPNSTVAGDVVTVVHCYQNSLWLSCGKNWRIDMKSVLCLMGPMN
jgi:hypothetical protein